jgi:NAD+ diphosphatase
MKIFKYCPSCKSNEISFDGIKQFKCNSCGFIYFHNVATAAAAILEYEQKIFFIKRVRQPGKGKLDLPGGFIDPNETAEEGLNRELKEELGITLDQVKYLGAFPNRYEYENVTYNTCDLFFYSKIEILPTEFDKSEIETIELIDPLEIQESRIAFDSIKRALRLFTNIKYPK